MIVDIDEEFTVRLYHDVKDTKPYASISIDELIEAWEWRNKVVQCKECKHWVSDGGAIMFCEQTDIPTDDDDFCSYGERKNDPSGKDVNVPGKCDMYATCIHKDEPIAGYICRTCSHNDGTWDHYEK